MRGASSHSSPECAGRVNPEEYVEACAKRAERAEEHEISAAISTVLARLAPPR
jgi:hypothetical protein